QECEETAQKNKQKLYDLEQMCEKLAHENNSVKNTLSNAEEARSSLRAACALLSGALYPLYYQMCAMSCQRDILQDQMNLHQLVNHKIISLLSKNLVYVFRRAVIAVLAANRLRALGWYSCTLFVWKNGPRGSPGIKVCVGQSRGRHYMSWSEEEGGDCTEPLDWLTSSGLYDAIINSCSELQGILH
ncbi:CC171 protein, partial [Chloropsis cyanopogon]|nr:CC171 protein [Chloropsis cyanopogon]